MKHTLTKGKEAFLEYYSKVMPNLEEYLKLRNIPVLLFSPIHEKELKILWSKAGLSWEPLDWFRGALEWPKEVEVGTYLPGYEQGWIYSLNRASLLPVTILRPQKGELILDACAAPGGKSLAILRSGASLMVNDASFQRFKRLKTVLRLFGFGDTNAFQKPVQSLQYVYPGQFDKILLDAPCSSEKHVFNSKMHLKIWSVKRTSVLSQTQIQLVEALLPMLKSRGILVYSTCSISPLENENVVEKVLARHPEVALLETKKTSISDINFDPMFVAKFMLRK